VLEKAGLARSPAPPGGRPENDTVAIQSPSDKPPGKRRSIRQAWTGLRPLQQALIILVLVSGVCCAGVAAVAVALGVWTGS
jgi:hypothetical protein